MEEEGNCPKITRSLAQVVGHQVENFEQVIFFPPSRWTIPRFSYYIATENLAAAKPHLETEIEDILKDIESKVILTSSIESRLY